MESLLFTKAKKLEKRSNCVLVDNILFPKISEYYSPEQIRSAFFFLPRNQDVLLCSYPKSDCKLIEIILWNLIYVNVSLPERDKVIGRHLKCMEMIGLDAALAGTSPRLIKTHLPAHLLSLNTNAKYIYIVRNPKDVCVSYFNFLKSLGADYESFDAYFDKFIYGLVPYGDFFEHVASWNKHASLNKSILILPYENIKTNPRSVFFSVAAFLGERYLQMALGDYQLLYNVLEHFRLDLQKRGKRSYFPEKNNPFTTALNVSESLEAALCGSCSSEDRKSRKATETRAYEYSEEQKLKMKVKTSIFCTNTSVAEFWETLRE